MFSDKTIFSLKLNSIFKKNAFILKLKKTLAYLKIKHSFYKASPPLTATMETDFPESWGPGRPLL